MGPEVPCTAKKVFAEGFSRHLHRKSPPINFSVRVAVLQNNVTDRFIDNHIFSECQELTSDLKVARPVDEKIDFQLKTYKIFLFQKSGTRFYLGLPHGVFADSNCGAIFE